MGSYLSRTPLQGPDAGFSPLNKEGDEDVGIMVEKIKNEVMKQAYEVLASSKYVRLQLLRAELLLSNENDDLFGEKPATRAAATKIAPPATASASTRQQQTERTLATSRIFNNDESNDESFGNEKPLGAISSANTAKYKRAVASKEEIKKDRKAAVVAKETLTAVERKDENNKVQEKTAAVVMAITGAQQQKEKEEEEEEEKEKARENEHESEMKQDKEGKEEEGAEKKRKEETEAKTKAKACLPVNTKKSSDMKGKPKKKARQISALQSKLGNLKPMMIVGLAPGLRYMNSSRGTNNGTMSAVVKPAEDEKEKRNSKEHVLEHANLSRAKIAGRKRRRTRKKRFDHGTISLNPEIGGSSATAEKQNLTTGKAQNASNNSAVSEEEKDSPGMADPVNSEQSVSTTGGSISQKDSTPRRIRKEQAPGEGKIGLQVESSQDQPEVLLRDCTRNSKSSDSKSTNIREVVPGIDVDGQSTVDQKGQEDVNHSTSTRSPNEYVPDTYDSDDSDEERTSVVMDIGSAFSKVGFAGDSAPKLVFNTLVSKLKSWAAIQSGCDKRFVGSCVEAKSSFLLDFKCPIKHGRVIDWDSMEKIWRHSYNEILKVAPEETFTLVTESPMSDKYQRGKAAQILFERFNVPGMYSAIAGGLALYASGRTSGVSIDCGHDFVNVLPVFEGYAIKALARSSPGGYKLCDIMQEKLYTRGGMSFETFRKRRDLQRMCSELTYVATDYQKEVAAASSPFSPDLERIWNLPDGGTISITTERFSVPEELFFGRFNLPSKVNQSILACDIDVRKEFCSNIVLSGGTSMLPGLATRLQKEMEYTMLYKNISTRFTPRVKAPKDREYAAWVGGAMLTSLSTFKESVLIRKDEWDEYGCSIVYRKFST